MKKGGNKMSPIQLQDLFAKIDVSLYSTLLKICIAYFLVIILKSFIENLSNYFLFNGNPYVSIGRKVIVDGVEGIIKKITFGYIVIENEKEEYVIRISQWKNKKWIFLKNISQGE